MNKLLVILIAFLLFDISYPLNCNEFGNDPTCYGHNIQYQLKCLKDNSQNKCREYELDDGCQIDTNNNCVKTDTASKSYACIKSTIKSTINSLIQCKRINIDSGCKLDASNYCAIDSVNENEDCLWSDDGKTCKRVTKRCDLYSESNCGGLNEINNNKQCAQLDNYGKCKEIQLDDYCKIDSNGKCNPKTNLDYNYKCALNDEKTECKRQDKECEKYEKDTCSQHPSKRCYYVNDLYSCKKDLLIDEKCEITTSGDCQPKTGNTNLQPYEDCKYNDEYTSCQIYNKPCNSMGTTECDKCKSSPTGYKCSKIQLDENYFCKDVKIDTNLCEITAEGKCQIKTASGKNKCKYTNDSKTECKYYEVDNSCQLTDAETVACTDDTLDDQTKKCDILGENKNQCKPRNKICSDYTQETCEAVKNNTHMCSWINGYYCASYEISPECKVVGGKCQDVQTRNDNKKCLFDYQKRSCKLVNNECSKYFNDCPSHHDNSQTNTECVKLAGEDYCKEVEIETVNCEISSGKCESKKVHKVCSLSTDKTKCNAVDKKCSEYNYRDDCNANSKCSYLYIDPYNYERCIEIGATNECPLTDKNCNKNIDDNQKCDFIYDSINDKAICQKRNKFCSELAQDKCNILTNNYQCYYSGGYCYNITVDGNCKVNDNYECVENGENKINAQKEKCSFINGKSECVKTEKTCSDYPTDNCAGYTPTAKLCFNIDGYGCREIPTDSQCRINEDNECTGNNCEFVITNNKVEKCAYKGDKNEASLLNLKLFYLLVLFFMF